MKRLVIAVLVACLCLCAAIALTVRWYQKQGEILDRLHQTRKDQHTAFEENMKIRQAYAEAGEMKTGPGASRVEEAARRKAFADVDVMVARERVRRADAKVEEAKKR